MLERDDFPCLVEKLIPALPQYHQLLK